MRDFSDDLADLYRRVESARSYLDIDGARARMGDLESEVSRPDLWDDPDAARAVTTELSQLRDDVELVDGLAGQVSDLETLAQLAREEGDESFEAEIEEGIGSLRRRARCARAARAVQRRARRPRRDLHRQFGRGRNRRAGLDQHAASHVPPVGGAPALRGGDRGGLRGHRGGSLVGDVHREGPVRVRPADERAGCAPPDPHLALRCQRAPPDRVRVVRHGAGPRRQRRNPRSMRATSASIRTARRAPAANT